MSRLFLADATRWATTSPQKPVVEKEDASFEQCIDGPILHSQRSSALGSG